MSLLLLLLPMLLLSLLLLTVTVLGAVAVDTVMRALARTKLLGIVLIVGVVIHVMHIFQAKKLVLIRNELLRSK